MDFDICGYPGSDSAQMFDGCQGVVKGGLREEGIAGRNRGKIAFDFILSNNPIKGEARQFLGLDRIK